MFTRRELLVTGGVAAGALTAGLILSRQPPVAEGGYFPNCSLRTHDGRTVRFYDDLVKGKVVAINMMYARCEGICPRMTDNLLRVQAALGERLGKEVFMYSITLQPAHDTPEVLQQYVKRQRQEPRWPFLTGTVDDIELVRHRLGFYDVDPEVDADRKQHTGMVRLGNERLDRWTMTPALAKPDQIAGAILRLRGRA